MKRTFNITFVSLFLLAMTLGCGGGRQSIKTDFVEGTVTYKGAPVSGASINFSPVSTGAGSPAYGITNGSGSYKIQTLLGASDRGTTPGEYIVTVAKSESIPSGRFEADSDGNRYEVMSSRSLIPEIYSSVGTSTLRATVKSGGPNKFDFELID